MPPGVEVLQDAAAAAGVDGGGRGEQQQHDEQRGSGADDEAPARASPSSGGGAGPVSAADGGADAPTAATDADGDGDADADADGDADADAAGGDAPGGEEGAGGDQQDEGGEKKAVKRRRKRRLDAPTVAHFMRLQQGRGAPRKWARKWCVVRPGGCPSLALCVSRSILNACCRSCMLFAHARPLPACSLSLHCPLSLLHILPNPGSPCRPSSAAARSRCCDGSQVRT